MIWVLDKKKVGISCKNCI